MNKLQAGLLLAGMVSSCQFRTFHHVPSMAAESASEFARVAFVQQDYESAWKLLWEPGQQRLSVAVMEETIKKIHPRGFPAEIVATDYEPIFGQPAMSIFLCGSAAGEGFYYRLVLQGTEETGYRVSDFFRGSGPYPPSSIRKPLVSDCPQGSPAPDPVTRLKVGKRCGQQAT